MTDDLKARIRGESRDWLVSAIVLHRKDFLPNVESYTDDELREIAFQEILRNVYESERDQDEPGR